LLLLKNENFYVIPSFDMLKVTNRATISDCGQNFIIWSTRSISRSKGHHHKIYPNHKNDVRL